jgi:hypothetical protein
MRKLTLLLALVMATVLVSVAAAAPPIKITEPFAGTFFSPAGDICDFNYLQEFSGTDEVTIFSDGRVQVHEFVTVSHTNEDTDFTLTETDRIVLTFYADGSEKAVGVFWHLRDASGKLVVVQAGQLRFDPVGNTVKFTPHINPGFAEVVCPALGGSPA